MAISPFSSSPSPVAPSGGQAEKDQAKLGGDLEMFLNMLTTQLKNQDPLSPMDSNEFTAQLVQFASVEQQINQNANLEKLISLQQGNQLSSAVNYIGHTAKVESSNIVKQDGQADFSYLLPQDAAEVEIVIMDVNNRVVKVEAAQNLKAGEYQRNWDGKDTSNNVMPDGIYKVKVTGVGTDGKKFSVPTAMIGRITGVTTGENGDPLLSISGLDIPMDQVISLSETRTAAAPPPATGGTDGENAGDEDEENEEVAT